MAFFITLRIIIYYYQFPSTYILSEIVIHILAKQCRTRNIYTDLIIFFYFSI